MRLSIAFGPVPSRRLGRSLGVNNIPPKSCSYSCVYCQVGPTAECEIAPRTFYAPAEIERSVAERVATARSAGEAIDFLTFVPDGEPTLDCHLGEAIDRLCPLGIPVAVVSNASLLWRDDVRAALARADWVSIKVDSAHEGTWRRINRPHPDLSLAQVLDGIRRFAGDYSGTLTTETMLVDSMNDSIESVAAVADFIAPIAPATAYLTVPTRPPAVSGVAPPSDAQLAAAYAVLSGKIDKVEHLIGYEGDAFACTGDPEHDLLSITAVHPMREQAVARFLQKARADWYTVEHLIAEGKLHRVSYAGVWFYLRRPPGPR